VGNDAFAKRWSRRLAYRKKQGESSAAAKRKIGMGSETELEKQAKAIVRVLASEYGCDPNTLLRGRGQKRSVGKARTILANLLRDYLPWSCREIARYMNLKDYTTIYHHQEKLRENKNLSAVYKKILGQWNR